MAYVSWKDIADITFNSTDLKAYVRGVSGLKQNVTVQEFHPAGATYPTPVDTGSRSQDPIAVEFMFDGSASGPNVKCALGTSATLNITLATGMTKSGTFIVTDVEPSIGPDQSHLLNVTFTPTGTITDDLTA